VHSKYELYLKGHQQISISWYYVLCSYLAIRGRWATGIAMSTILLHIPAMVTVLSFKATFVSPKFYSPNDGEGKPNWGNINFKIHRRMYRKLWFNLKNIHFVTQSSVLFNPKKQRGEFLFVQDDSTYVRKAWISFIPDVYSWEYIPGYILPNVVLNKAGLALGWLPRVSF
jgi:hypothetical protein